MANEKFAAEEGVVDKTNPSWDSGIDSVQEGTLKKVTKISSILTVAVSGLALFSDGYNAQVIGYMEPLLADLYPNGWSDGIGARLSNSYLIGEIFGMLGFGYLIDKIGRRTGIIFATLLLVLGIILATAAHGKSERGSECYLTSDPMRVTDLVRSAVDAYRSTRRRRSW
jgi:hypothetical protein